MLYTPIKSNLINLNNYEKNEFCLSPQKQYASNLLERHKNSIKLKNYKRITMQ